MSRYVSTLTVRYDILVCAPDLWTTRYRTDVRRGSSDTPDSSMALQLPKAGREMQVGHDGSPHGLRILAVTQRLIDGPAPEFGEHVILRP